MKIEAVKMMRELREKISAETKDMTWAEEQKYLADHITVFSGIANKAPNIRLKGEHKNRGPQE
jgi:hypothetical protein